MNTVNLPVIKGVVDDMIDYHEKQTVAVPVSLCMDLFGEIPKPSLQRLLPPTLEIKGFRAPIKAPVRMIFDAILNLDATWLGFILGRYCIDALSEISEQSVKQIRIYLADLVQEYSPAMIRFALHVDRRKSVRGLSEMFDTLITASSGVEEQSPSGDAAAETASAADACQPEDGHGLGLDNHVEPQQPREEKADVNRVLQKRLAKTEKLVAQRDAQIRKLRQEQGERDRALGKLRRDLEETQRTIDRLSKELQESRREISRLQHLEQELTRTAERQRELETRERVFEALFGSGAMELKNQLLDGIVHIHALESQLAGLHMLLAEKYRQRDAVMENLRHVAHVPVSACIDVVKHYLESLLRQQVAQIEQGDAVPTTQRLACADTMKEYLRTIAVLERLETDDEQVSATCAVEIPLVELRQQLEATEAVKLEVVGTLRYEGPQVWLVAQDQVLGLPQGLLDQDDLVTGNQVRLVLSHDRNTLVDMEAEIIDRVESQVINDALRYGNEGLYIQSISGQPIMISQYEFLRAQVEVGEPLQVIVPKWPYRKGTQDLFGRIAKKLPHSGLYLQRRKAVAGAHKKTQSESGALEFQPLLANRNVLVIGGNGNEQCYQTVVEGMGGRFHFQSGFEQLTRIPGKVRSADLIVLVTGCVLHAVSNMALTEAKRTNTPLYFFNSLGRTSFMRFMEELYANELEQRSAAG
ncbi:MAG TPA: DUF2325 domain-containing protein [Firmicutes bacterium]|nr:DUF2325 domain-containing protein [Bacillota bacterium]